MNYKQSQQILDEIKKADKILLNCHRGPDPDGIGSTLAMKHVLEGMGKNVKVVCPTRTISKQTDYLDDYRDIVLGVDFQKFDFSKFDLLIALDTPNINLLTGRDEKIDNSELPIKTIVIDHHYISTLSGHIKLVDVDSTSVGEMLFSLFEDWVIDIDKKLAECLLTSIIGDTGAFAYPNVTAKTLRVAADLIDYGVDKDMIIGRLYRNESMEMLKFWSEVLKRMEIDMDNKFVYAFIPYDVYKRFEKIDDAKAKSASLFAPIVEGTNFGFIAVEEEPGSFSVSFRGRTGFDTSEIAKKLGGGGHKVASAVKINGISFDEAVIKILETTRKIANDKKGI